MKRKTKNIIMLAILVVTILLTILTIYFKNNITTPSSSQEVNTNENIKNQQMNEGDNTRQAPPEMSEGDTTRQAPPEMNGKNTTRQSPPEMSEGDTTKQSPSEMNGENTTRQAPPEMNEGDTTRPTPPEMNNGNNVSTINSQESKSNTPLYFYIIFTIEGLIISSIIIYLILSKFNKKSVKETFVNNDKKVIFGLLVLILTALSTMGASLIKFPVNNKTSEEQKQQTSNISYKSANEIKEDKTIESKNYNSTTADENALLVSGKVNVTVEDSKVTKTGDSNGGDTTSFYGTNSGVIAKDGANLTIENATIETDATGANGVFSYGGSATTSNSSSDGTTVTIKNSKITTKKDNSGGIMTTGGGITKAENLTVETSGVSSAAIRTDRGGGKVTVNKGTYKTSGAGSPAIYSTADVTVKSATLTSSASEGIVIEGKNSVNLEDVKLTDNNTKLNGKSTTYKNIFLYQSMSGDASTGEAEFSAKDSTIVTEKGDTFYVTNTSAKITLENNKITNKDSSGNFLRIQKDSWGNSGSNGGNVTLSMNNQTAEGNIIVDEISTLTLNIKSKSKYTGSINNENTAKEVIINIDKNSNIKLTGDTYVSELNDDDKTYSNIDFNGYKLYVNGKAIN